MGCCVFMRLISVNRRILGFWCFLGGGIFLSLLGEVSVVGVVFWEGFLEAGFGFVSILGYVFFSG